MRVAIIGSGAMGCLFGGKLASVVEVALIDPWRQHVDQINQAGLLISEPEGDETVRVSATTDPTTVGNVDLGIVFVKSSQTPWAGAIAREILNERGMALTLQNGLGNGETLAGILGKSRAWQGVTSHGATMLGPGHIRHAGSGPTYVERRPEQADLVSEVESVFASAGLELHLSDEVESLVWSKLVINVGINALTALLRVPNGVLASNEAAGRVMDAAVSEAVGIARAKGIELPYPDPIARVREVATATGQNRSSMLQDAMRGSASEVGVINGAVVREAAKLRIPAPVNQTLLDLMLAMESSKEQRLP